MTTTPAEVLRDMLFARVDDQAVWLSKQLSLLSAGATERDLHIFLGFAPRRLGKVDLAPTESERVACEMAHHGWNPGGWSVDGAARVLGLLTFACDRPFADTFKDLRRTSDLAELIALYRGLPLYPDPESLFFEVGEGLRSNLKPVFEAIAHDNPYPRDHFDDHRWNHMVLKALFVDSQLAPILGLRQRANPELARILIDYAQERWAAGRPVTPELWIPVRPFIEAPDIAPLLEAAIAEGKLTEEELI